MSQFKRLPRHIGVIPDGNRRWAVEHGLAKEGGYRHGLGPGLRLCEQCLELGIAELTFFGFTQDNTKRAAVQRQAFTGACVEAVKMLAERDTALLVIGDDSSAMFPEELRPYTRRRVFGKGTVKVNLLVNYSWKWDLNQALRRPAAPGADQGGIVDGIASREASRIDLIIRWGGRRRLSGFLPVQSVYADFYTVEEMWPDFEPRHFHEALNWYQQQDITLGG